MARTNAEAVLLQILRESDGEWTGKTRMFKAFYFAHLYYAASHPRRLTSHPIACMPQGPGIHEGDQLFAAMAAAGLITTERAHEGPYPEFRFRLTEKGRASALPPDDARSAVRDAVAFCRDKSAAQLSQITHEHSRAWRQASPGDLLDVELDLIPDDEFEAREAGLGALAGELDRLLGGKKA